MKRIRTVLGDVSPQEAGVVLPHEHFFIDLRPGIQEADVSHAELEEEIRLDNFYRVSRFKRNRTECLLDEEAVAVEEAGYFAEAGGGTIVDVTPVGAGRDPLAIRRVARATGLHVVMGAGYYQHIYHPDGFAKRSLEHIADEIVSDVTDGIAETSIRAGIIGEIGMGWPAHPSEEKSLRAAALAQSRTGATLMIHPGMDAEAPQVHLEVSLEMGADPRRIIISHAERTLQKVEDMCLLAEQGPYLNFDLFGRESSHHPFPYPIPNDGMRIDIIKELFDRGYGDRLLVSQDICHKSNLVRYGGEGYHHILTNVVPLMRSYGMKEEEIDMLVVKNPAQALAFDVA